MPGVVTKSEKLASRSPWSILALGRVLSATGCEWVSKDVAVSILGPDGASWGCALAPFAVGACSHYVWSPLSVFLIQKF